MSTTASLPSAPSAVPRNVRWVLLGVMLAMLLSMLDNMVGIGAGGIGAGAFALIGAVVPPRERGKYQGMTASVMAIVLAATWAGSTYAWGSWQILCLGAAAITGLALFVLVEKRVSEPLLPLSVFTGHRNYPLAMAMLLAAGVVMFGAGLYLPMFQQTVQVASATNSGLLMLSAPWAGPSASPSSARSSPAPSRPTCPPAPTRAPCRVFPPPPRTPTSPRSPTAPATSSSPPRSSAPSPSSPPSSSSKSR